MSAAHQKRRVEDDEDLEDLDDVLDQFSPQAPPSSSSQPAPGPADMPDEGFAEELAKGMVSLLKGPNGAEHRERLTAWEAMLIEGMDSIPAAQTGTPGPGEGPSSTGPKEDDFRSKIRSTMNRLKESETDLKSTDPSVAGGNDFESLLSQWKNVGNMGDDIESDEQFQNILEDMMGQLMNKDVLYEPLKELHDKFPSYIAENSSSISPEDKERFEAQIVCIKRLLDVFEARSYRDDDEEARKKIVDLMSELQSHGSPPEEIMGPLPPGFNMGADGLPTMPEDCNMQ